MQENLEMNLSLCHSAKECITKSNWEKVSLHAKMVCHVTLQTHAVDAKQPTHNRTASNVICAQCNQDRFLL